MDIRLMKSNFLLPDNIHGRSIFKNIIPTSNNLERTFDSLESKNWCVNELKVWEKSILKSYKLLDNIHELLVTTRERRAELVKQKILLNNANDLGSYPICIYLISYFIQLTGSKKLADFKKFVKEHELKASDNSVQIIWSTGTKDGKYLGFLNEKLDIIDFAFWQQWVCSNPPLSHKKIKIRKPKKTLSTIVIGNSQQEHMDFFRDINDENKVFKGQNSALWISHVMGEGYKCPPELNKQLYRDEVWLYCKDSKSTNLDALLAILSWGGMKREHAKRLLKSPDPVMDIVMKLRKQYFKSRSEAFDYIQDKRNTGLLPGMGIGYFTKLICFLQPELNGYIMDQWLAKSVNLLSGKMMVHIANSKWVSDQNDAVVYEEFCLFIDELALNLETTGFKTEERLFSVGGRKKGKWRSYLIKCLEM
ncbi:8-oxoguanine DNA glycosylase OGG fold protein [Sphingobacterium luzhongxinii]|uniref:8-oxoguanine DNA glycosylase OGG fold protein n=1 Tax=Sphingobacterium luzhongxinii TaxID=2654181 RepID=UPI0013DD5144|nr:hypothetical protein [Sphingobacterium sp. xlx-73]